MKVTVIGAAGSVGAPSAFYIAASGLADEVVLIDMRPNVVQQHAMDMSTAVSALDISVIAGTDEDLAGSDVVINAAGVHQGLITDRMEMLPKNLPLVRETALKIKRYLPGCFRHHRHQSGRSAQLRHVAGRGLRPPQDRRILVQRFLPVPRDGGPGQGREGEPGRGYRAR